MSEMLFHETFVRCPACESPYFERHEHVTLDKETWEKTKEPVEECLIHTYICRDCGKVFAEKRIDAMEQRLS